MKLFWLTVSLILSFSFSVFAKSDPPRATMNIGIYYTFRQKYAVKQINEKEDVIEFDSPDEIKIKVENLIRRVNETINSLFPERIIDFKIALLKYWKMPDDARDAYEIFGMFEKTQKARADIYLILTDTDLYAAFLQFSGITNKIGGDEIILANFSSAPDIFLELLLIHEIGHALSLTHPDQFKAICEMKVVPITCSNSVNYAKDKIIMDDESFVKALYSFYRQKTKSPR